MNRLMLLFFVIALSAVSGVELSAQDKPAPAADSAPGAAEGIKALPPANPGKFEAYLSEPSLMEAVITEKTALPLKSSGFFFNTVKGDQLLHRPSDPARTAGVNGKLSFAIFGISPVESVMTLEPAGTLKSVMMWIWTDADQAFTPLKLGSLGKFEEKVTELQGKLDALTGKKMIKMTRPVRDMNTQIWCWDAGDRYWRLDAGYRDEKMEKPQYLKITLCRKEATDRMDEKYLCDRGAFSNKDSLPKNLVKDADGTVWISNIPMVDQGQKGYCAAATMARLLQYYGRDIDMHQMASMAGTTPDGGTSTKAQDATIEAVRVKLWLLPDKKPIFSLLEEKTLKAEVAAYNKLAKKADRPAVGMQAFIDRQGVDKEILKKSMAKNIKKFKSEIKKTIDRGIPIFWSMTVGLYEENGEPVRQNGGGHLRLIIGYKFDAKDKSPDEVIFSDTWGYGQEKKRIKLENAVPCTTRMQVVPPSNKVQR